MKFRIALLLLVVLFPTAKVARGQSFGIELFNNLMPASGGMGGASIATPQDVQSAVYGNPSTLTQYRGTHFGMSGAWVEPTFKLAVDGPLPGFGVMAFPETKSDAQGVAPGNITVAQDYTALGLPITVGIGIANESLMDGRLLLALDGVYQLYTDTALFGALYEDQWAIQTGAQFALGERIRLRLGYAWAENPMRELVRNNAGGVLPPGGATHIQYIEALFAAINEHRLTGGIGVRDVLPGIDLDLLAGGMFEDSQTFGVTTATVESYWVGAGMTWRFGRGNCEEGCW